jgi:hypothetical protein
MISRIDEIVCVTSVEKKLIEDALGKKIFFGSLWLEQHSFLDAYWEIVIREREREEEQE